MENLREKISIRGTLDCPFQRYSFIHRKAGTEYASVHWHPEVEILYTKKGCMEVRVDKNIISLHTGQIAFIPPGKLHSIRGLENNCSYDAFVFSLDLISPPESHFFYKEVIDPLRTGKLRFPYILYPTDESYTEAVEALTIVAQISKSHPHYKRIIFKSMINLFVAMMDKMVLGCSDSIQKNNDTIKKCLQYMNQNYKEQLTLAEIAEHIHLHPNYLCTLFKNYTGKTVFQYLLRIRIENAAALLRSGDISVSEAASKCGFESTSFFSKKFKKFYGLSPKEYSLRHK